MAYAEVPLPRFAGLDLRDDPQEVSAGAALDALNVSLAANGRLRTRDGLSSFISSLGWVSAMAQHGTSGQLLVSYPTALKAYNSSGTLLATALTGGTGVGGFAQMSTGSGSSYATATFMPATNDTPQKWTGAAFANSGWNQHGSRATVWQDRVVYAGQGDNTGLLADADTIRFSDAGDGGTFTSTNYVIPTRADGETVTDIVAWDNKLFAFKQSKFFVFYGTSTDSSGNPIFNYNPVVGHGAIWPGLSSPDNNPHVAAAGQHGVYFLSYDGVYVTTGGPAVRISQELDPWFAGESLPYLSGIPTNAGFYQPCLGVVNERVYVCPDITQALTFVYDITNRTWTAYNWKMTAVCAYQSSLTSAPIALVALNTGASAGTIYKHSPSYTTDAGSAISWKYRTGFSDLGLPGAEKAVREWRIDGQGSVTVKTAVNDAATLGSGSTLTLGTAPATAQGWDRRSVRGRNVSVELSGSGVAQVSRVEGHVSAQRAPGLSAG